MPTVEQLLVMIGAEEAALATVVGQHAIILRDPQPNQIQVAQAANVELRVVDLDADPTDLAYPGMTVKVSIDSGSGFVVAYDDGAGGFQAGWSGAGSATAVHAVTDPYVFKHITIDQDPGTFPIDTTVSVRVEITAPGALDETYTFDTVDATAPKLLEAQAIGQKVVRCIFDDDMLEETTDGFASVTTATPETWNLGAGGETLTVKVDGGAEQEIVFTVDMWLNPAAVTDAELALVLSALVDGATGIANGTTVTLRSDTTGDGSKIQVTGGTANAVFGFPTGEQTGWSYGVLDPNNWSFERLNVFPEVAVSLEATACEMVDSMTVDVTVNWPMTPEAPYEVIVASDVTDTGGNAIDTDYDSYNFTGFVPDWPDDRDTTIKLPAATITAKRDPDGVVKVWRNEAQELNDLLVTTVDQVQDGLDGAKSSEAQIDLRLPDMGNPFVWADLDLTLSQRRKLDELLPDIYQAKGLAVGIEQTILLLLGIPVTVEDYITNCWRLGVDLLGDHYPAAVRCANTETYNLAAGGTLTVRVDGGVEQTATLVPGDFVAPAAATATEVAAALGPQISGGGAAAFDDGAGARIEILSATAGPDGQIQVTGGTANAVLGFDTTIHSGSGGCVLGPSDERALRTFDLVYSSVVPSDEEKVLMRKIANYMKTVNTHVGNIRAEKTIPVSPWWLLGWAYLGDGTILGA